jgi:RNA polymerase sigma-70 factor (ECF subfamily)
MARSGKRALYERLRPALAGDEGAPPYPVVAAELRLSVGAVKMATHRLRARDRQRLREAIARTVADPSEIDAEVRDLLATLGG